MFKWKWPVREEATEGGDAGGGDDGGKEEKPAENDEKPAESDEKPADEGGKQEKDEKNVDSPPDYTLALEKDSLLSEDDLKVVSEFAKSRKLSEADARELLNEREDAIGSHLDAVQAAHKEKTDGWKKEIEGRKEYKAEEEAVSNALKEFGGEELTKALEETGYRHWQPLWDTLKKVGDAMKDDTYEWGTTAKDDAPKTLGERMYGKTMGKKD